MHSKFNKRTSTFQFQIANIRIRSLKFPIVDILLQVARYSRRVRRATNALASGAVGAMGGQHNRAGAMAMACVRNARVRVTVEIYSLLHFGASGLVLKFAI